MAAPTIRDIKSRTDTIRRVWMQYPSSIVSGDLVLLYFTALTNGLDYSSVSPSTSARIWNRYSSDFGYSGRLTMLFWRVADGTEGSDTFSLNQPYAPSYNPVGSIVLSVADANCWDGCAQSDVFGDVSQGANGVSSKDRPFQPLNVTEKNGLTLGLTTANSETTTWSSPSLGNWNDVANGYTRVSRLAQISNHFGNTGGGSWQSNSSGARVYFSLLVRGLPKNRRIFIT